MTVMKYLNVPSSHMQGVLFRNDKKKEIILTFRGINSIQYFQYDYMWSLTLMNCQIAMNAR
jgi:hypothetical protein